MRLTMIPISRVVAFAFLLGMIFHVTAGFSSNQKAQTRLLTISSTPSVYAQGAYEQNFDINPITDVSVAPAAAAASEPDNKSKLCTGSYMPGAAIDCVFKTLLFGIASLFGMGVSMSAAIFIAFTNDQVMGIFGLNAIYTGWSFVRDVFNIVFILSLLFSAFGTIFQVSKYSLKSSLLWIILMALLVNFSWPIARVIIDATNVLMFFFIPADIGSAGLFSSIQGGTNFAQVLLDASAASGSGPITTTNLFLIIIFTFLFAIVLLGISLTLLIRVAALVMLLILAPVGFAGMAFAGTRGLADKWWGAFLKYALVGPAMIFMIALANLVLVELGSDIGSGGSEIAQGVTGVIGASGDSVMAQTGLGRTILLFLVPLVFLWSALLVGGQMGTYGASTIQGYASKGARRTGSALRRGTMNAGRVVDNTVLGNRVNTAAGRLQGLGARLSNVASQSKAQAKDARDTGKALTLSAPGTNKRGAERDAYKKLQETRTRAQEEKYKDTDISELISVLKAEESDDVQVAAAQRQIAAKGGEIKDVSEFKKAFGAIADSKVKDASSAEKLMKNADDNIFRGADETTFSELSENMKKFTTTMTNEETGATQEDDKKTQQLEGFLTKRLVDNGRVDARIAQTSPQESQKVLQKLTNAQLASQKDAFKKTDGAVADAVKNVARARSENPISHQEMIKNMDQDTLNVYLKITGNNSESGDGITTSSNIQAERNRRV